MIQIDILEKVISQNLLLTKYFPDYIDAFRALDYQIKPVVYSHVLHQEVSQNTEFFNKLAGIKLKFTVSSSENNGG